uniref:Palmitoyltransferase n=1 Tax=Macrostomum lignano TaxID=282301 RepID=A0A1I8HW99_9PLAT
MLQSADRPAADGSATAIVPLPDELPLELQSHSGEPQIVVKMASGRSGVAHLQQPPRTARLCWQPCSRLCGIQQFWFVQDACGITCAAFTWLLLLFAEAVLLFVVLIPAPSLAFKIVGAIVYHCLAFMAGCSHVRAVLTDPGTVPLNNDTKENLLRLAPAAGDGQQERVVYRCPRCSCIKPERAHHCSICRRCVRRMDHHCPWVNNCVGEGNQKFFILFTGYIALTSFFAIYLCIHEFIICIGTEWQACQNGPQPPVSTLLLFALVITGLVFGLFTVVMACSQLVSIVSDTTGIEQIKGERRGDAEAGGGGGSRLSGLQRVFGSPPSWRWLSPFHSPKPPAEQQQQQQLTSQPAAVNNFDNDNV